METLHLLTKKPEQQSPKNKLFKKSNGEIIDEFFLPIHQQANVAPIAQMALGFQMSKQQKQQDPRQHRADEERNRVLFLSLDTADSEKAIHTTVPPVDLCFDPNAPVPMGNHPIGYRPKPEGLSGTRIKVETDHASCGRGRGCSPDCEGSEGPI